MNQRNRLNLPSLVLNVNRVWFDDVQSGTKTEEYRLYNEYWIKRLINPDGSPKNFKNIKYKLGYPKSADKSRCLVFKWCGYELKTIVHPHFNNEPKKVFAIKLDELVGGSNVES